MQVGGPSGQMVGPDQFDRKICFDDLATGGSMMVFGPDRDLLEVVARIPRVLRGRELRLLHALPRGQRAPPGAASSGSSAGRAEPDDLELVRQVGADDEGQSRCGLGQTSPNPVLSTLENFPSLYEARVKEDPDGYRRSFDLKQAVAIAEELAGHESVHAASGE